MTAPREKTTEKRKPRFYLAQAKSQGQTLLLDDDLMHYASRVLRLLDGASLRIWNGLGEEFNGQIQYLSKKLAQVTLTGPALGLDGMELARRVFVLQALPEGDKMDWVLEKCTELGATGFYPVQAERSVVKLDGERAKKRHAHWERIVMAASLQSERALLPQVHGIGQLDGTLAQLVQNHPSAELLWFTPQAGHSLGMWASKASPSPDCPLIVCVGPEGGWSARETELAMQMGAQPLKFSNRILRTETFAIACLSQLTARLGLDPI